MGPDVAQMFFFSKPGRWRYNSSRQTTFDSYKLSVNTDKVIELVWNNICFYVSMKDSGCTGVDT